MADEEIMKNKSMKSKKGMMREMKHEGMESPKVEASEDAKLPKDAMAPKEPEDHEKEMWMNTLMEAEEIKKDPKKMAHIHGHADKKVNKIKSISDLKLAYEAQPWKHREKEKA